jgi:MHS family shikimate/dehydroshikimate transporter-like MFS transporter
MANIYRRDARAPRKSSIRQVILASFIGTSIEWYDFFLYGTAAALVFNKLFFPMVNPLTGTLSAFGTFAVGFVARPVGGVLFGHYGDKIGRKSMLVYSLLIMGVATFLIGVTPTYHSVGFLAPILLVVLRFAQGIGVGGEWGGAVLMAVEHAGERDRGFYGSWPQMGVSAGLLLSTGVFALLSSLLSESQFIEWGWRIPFLLSFVLIGVGLFVRLKILESPVFEKLKENQSESPFPVLELFRNYQRIVVLATGMRIAENGSFYLATVFVLSYAESHLSLPRSVPLFGVILSAIIGLFTVPCYAALSDRVGRRPLYLTGALFILIFAYPFFWLLNSRSPALIAVAIILVVNVGHDAMYGPQAAFLSELFGPQVRYTGTSLTYQLSSVLSGGIAPLIATALLAAFGANAVAAYLATMGLISTISAYLAPESFRREIAQIRQNET